MIVDSQCHVSQDWYEPIESLLYQMDRHGVGQAVLTQMLGQTDNTYQQDCVARYPDRLASIVLVDPSALDACDQLRKLAENGANGVRFRPGARSPGSDPLAIWRAAESCGLAVSCVGSVITFAQADFVDLVTAVPKLEIVLEHLGGSSRPDADDAEKAARRQVFELARYPNVYLKLPGLGELAARATKRVPGAVAFDPPVPPVLMDALTHFGPDRLMWGSDYPPVSSREGYGNALRWAQAAVSTLSQEAQAGIFGGVARRVFKFT